MAENTLNVRIKNAVKTEEEWAIDNPVLKSGEIAITSGETNYGRIKVGDGQSPWSDLQYTDYGIYSKIKSLDIGGTNLIRNSGYTYSVDKDVYLTHTYIPVSPLVAGRKYTVSLCVTPGTGVQNLSLFVSNGYYNLISLHNNGYEKQILTGTFIANYYSGRDPENSIDNANIQVYRYPNDGTVTGTTTLHWIKIEKGEYATDWNYSEQDIVGVFRGGTGRSTLTAGYALIGNGTETVDFRAIDTTTGGTSDSNSLITSGAVYSGLSQYLKIDGNAKTASQIYSTTTNPSTGTSYCIPFHSVTSSGNKALLNNDGLKYWTAEGSTSSIGVGELGLGNNIASGTAGNKRGMIYMYGTSSGYTEIYPGNNSTSNINITLPSSTGTLALLTDNVASATKLQTARTITIGNTSKTFDGTGNVSWSIAEIGAVNKTGDTISGTLTLGAYTGTATTFTGGIKVHDLRDATINPGAFGEQHVNFYFDTTSVDDAAWKAIMHIKGWTGAYAAHEVAFNAHNDAAYGSLYHRTGLSNTWQPWRKILDSSNYLSTIGNSYVFNKQNIQSTNMNAVASMNNAMGMAYLNAPTSGTASYVNPNAQTGWHHFINISYETIQTNMWQTQIANLAGTTDLWVRSRQGSSVSNDTEWSAPWTRILTGSNYTNVTDSRYVKKSGDTITGNLSYNMYSYTSIPLKVYGGNANGQGISIGAGASTIVGGGESAKWLESQISATTEILTLASDDYIQFWMNCQDQDISKAATVYLNAARQFYPATNNTGSIGTSSNQWANVYAATLHGSLDGNASTASAWATARAIKIGNTSKNVDGSANVTWTTDEIGALEKIVGYYGSDSAGTSGWYKVCTVSLSGYGDNIINLLLTSGYDRQASGILHIHTRCNNSTTVYVQTLKWMFRYGFNAGDAIITTGSNTWSLYVYQSNAQYGRILVQVLSKSGTAGGLALSLSNNTTKESSTPSGTTSSDGATVWGACRVYDSNNSNQISITYSKAAQSSTSWLASWNGYELGSIAPANARASMNGMAAINANGYYGMGTPSGDTSAWIRTTSNGIIPYQEGGASDGHCYIGTSTWRFGQAYINKVYTNQIVSSLTTTTHLAGNQGTAIIHSTAAGTGYNILAKMNSTNGVWTMGSHGQGFHLYYTANTTINAGTNAITKDLLLLNEAGNSTFPGTVSAQGFSLAKSSGDVYYISARSDTGVSMGFGVGSGGTNHGIWSYKLNKWMIYGDASAVYLNGNASTASKWATARTITLTGSVTGSVSIDGSGNVSLATTTNHTHDNIVSGSNKISVNQSTTNDYAGLGKKNNVNIDTWYGFSISNKCSGQGVAVDGVAFSVNARDGYVYAKGTVTAPTFSGTTVTFTATDATGGTVQGAGHVRITAGTSNGDRGAIIMKTCGYSAGDTDNSASSGTYKNAMFTIRDYYDNDKFKIGYDTTGSYVMSTTIYNRVGTGASQVVVGTNGTLFRTTSASKYKLNIEKIEDESYAYNILKLDPKSWFNKFDIEAYAVGLEAEQRGEDPTKASVDYNCLKIDRENGLIAEDVEAAGLSAYCQYGIDAENNKKEIEGLQYDRLTTLLIPIVRDLVLTMQDILPTVKDQIKDEETLDRVTELERKFHLFNRSDIVESVKYVNR